MLKLDEIINEIKKASDYNKLIKNLSALDNKIEAYLMRRYTKEEWDRLTEEEKRRYLQYEPIRKLIDLKYDILRLIQRLK